MGKDIYLDHATKKFEIEEAEIRQKEALEKKRRSDIEEISCLMGQIKAFGYMARFTSIAELINLKKIKDDKRYKDFGIDTWQGFCERWGLKARTVDDYLLTLDQLGLEFMESTQKLGLTRQDLRRLRALPDDARTEAVNQAISIENPTKEQVRDILDKIADQADDIAILKDKLKKSEEKLAKKDSAIVKGQEQCCELEDQIRNLHTRMEQSVIRADEKTSVDLLSEIKRDFDGTILKIGRIDLDSASKGAKAAVVSLIEYMNRMLKQSFLEICQAHPEIDAHDVLDVPGFNNPWDTVVYNPEKDQKIAGDVRQRLRAVGD